MIATDGASSGADDRPLTLAFLGDPNSIHIRRWVGHFARLGHMVTLLLPEDQAIEPGLDSSIAIARFEPYWRRRPVPVGALAARRSLARALRRLDPDVLHAHYLTVHGWHARLSGFHPYAVTLWGSDILITARSSLRGRLYARLSLGPADLVTGDSRDVLAAALRAGARADRLRLVQFGVDTERFRPGPEPIALRGELGLEGRRVVFSPRTIAPLYRHRVVLEALASLPDDVTVVMTRKAAQASEVMAIETRALELGLADRIRILPTLEHDAMVDLYRLADVVVSIPASDATPVTLLEALAVERPVVASDVPSVREWLAEVDPDAMVPVDDVASTTAAMAAALREPADRRAAIAARGRELVLRRGSQDANMSEVEVLYRSMRAPLTAPRLPSRPRS